MKVTLGVKTFVLVTTLIVVVASVLTVASTARQRQILTQELERLTETLVHNLAFNSEYGVLVGDRQRLKDLVDGVMQERDVVYAAVMDHDLNLLAQGARGQADRRLAASFHPELSGRPVFAYVGRPNDQIYLLQHPVMLIRRQRWSGEGVLFPGPSETTEDLIGLAVVGVSTRSLVASLKQVRRTTFELTGAIVLLAWLASYVLVSLLTKPLRQLKRATQDVAAGNLEVRLTTRLHDEVGELTHAFNQMVDEIRRSRQRIDEYTSRLEATAKELTSLNDEMEDVLRVVSHDLRAPLINIQGFSKRLEPILQEAVGTLERAATASQDERLRGELSSVKTLAQTRFAESLQFISKGVEKMDSLLSSLLAISRVGRKADPVQPNDLDRILDDVLATFDHQLTERAIRIIRHPLPQAVPCRRNEINQVFSNLLSNAINYMGPAEQRFIEIGGMASEDRVECFVRDTGIGIGPEDQERVFQMFTRLHALDVPGEGIGLAYVKKILRSHGGRIWVDSQRGQGSTFHFTLSMKPVDLRSSLPQPSRG